MHGFLYPMFCLAAYTGARRSEMLRARIAGVDLAGQTILLHEKKRAKLEPQPENAEAELTSSEEAPSDPGTPERKPRPKRPAQSAKAKPQVMLAKQMLQAPAKPPAVEVAAEVQGAHGGVEVTAEVKGAAESAEEESSAAEQVDSPTS
jgi:hypothetical protein